MKINDYKSVLPDILLIKEIRNSNIREVTLADYLNTLFLKNSLQKNREVLKPDLSVSALKTYTKKKEGYISVKNYSSALVVNNNSDLVKALSYEMLISLAQLIICVGASQNKSLKIVGEPAKNLIELQKENTMSIQSMNKMMNNLGEGLVFTGFKENKVSFTKELGSMLINVLKELSYKNLINSTIVSQFDMCDFLIDKLLVDSPKTSEEVFSNFNLSLEQRSMLIKKIINKTFDGFTVDKIAENKYNDILLKKQAGIIFNFCNFLDINTVEVEQTLIKGIENYHNNFKIAYPGLEPIYVQELLHKLPSSYTEFKNKIGLLNNDDKEFNFIEKSEYTLSFKVSCADYSKYQCFVNKAFISADSERVYSSLNNNVKLFNLANFEMIEKAYLKEDKNEVRLFFVSKGFPSKDFEPFVNILIDKLFKKDWREAFYPPDLQLIESEFISNQMKSEMKLDVTDNKILNKKSSLVKF